MNLRLNGVDFLAISPLLILLLGAFILLLLESFFGYLAKKLSFLITLATLAAAFIANIYAPISENPLLTPWLKFDSLSTFFTGFFLLIGAGSAILAHGFFKRFPASLGEYYFLLLAALSGLILMGFAADFLTLFIGLETLSIALYVLCGYMKKWEISQEASIKYFLMGSLATAFLLYGVALIYGSIGLLRFDALYESFRGIEGGEKSVLFFAGIALVTLGLCFKATIVPFHMWAPDVYEGASTPVTAFMTIGTKVGVFAAFLRVFFEALPHFHPLWNEAIAALAYPTLIFSNLLALRQTNLRRFFAYSGISHAGFLLIPLAASTPGTLSSILFYLIIYAAASFGAFSVIVALDDKKEGVFLTDLQGLLSKSPLLAMILTLSLLTLGGIPPTAGFFAKLYLFEIAFEAKYFGLVACGLLTTILSVFYYLRIIAYILTPAPSPISEGKSPWACHVLGMVSLMLLIVLTCYPSPFLDYLAKLKLTA